MQRFTGKVALITGGTSGLGKATAEAFIREGAKVVLAARRQDLGREVEASLRAAEGEATFVRCDITQEADVRALIDRTVSLYGRLDYAYNNAWSAPNAALLSDMPTESFDKELALLRGTFLCMKYEIPAIAASGGGAIVNCSSVVTLSSQSGLGAYSAAKAALETLARSGARECADKKIRVNSICCGGFQTPTSDAYAAQLSPEALKELCSRPLLKRLGKLTELAEAVLFLCAEPSYITGINLVVDGGYALT
jgi:NAD(P)-dependent dehydrogenase (short-subunit alcohol dehydrogenase family)